MTTWHAREPLSEAIWFALFNTWSDDAYEATCRSTLGIAIGSQSWGAKIRTAFSDLSAFNSKMFATTGPEKDLITIHVFLPDEAVDCWRSVHAVLEGPDRYRIVSINAYPDDERWEFGTGEVVRCELRRLGASECLVAVARA